MRPIKYFINNPYQIVLSTAKKVKWIFPDKLYLQLLFRGRMGYWPDLKHPQTFSEKLQWLKLYNRRPEYTIMVDKYAVKKYVADLIGENYIIPTLGVWDNPEDIKWDILPNQFVLKCTHDSGGIVICRDLSKLDKMTAIEKLHRGLQRSYFLTNREWTYKNVPRRIIAEKYMEDESGELRDYKFFCFNGVPKAMFIATDRFDKNEETKFDFYDMEFNHLPFRNGHPNSNKHLEKPKGFEEMKILAAKLSQNIPHVRVDFYDINGHIYFGEMTFFHWSGMVPFEPQEWDLKFGEWLELPVLK